MDPIVYKFGVNYDLPSNNGINDNENYAGDDHWIQFTSNLLSGTVKNVFGSATSADNPHQLEDILTNVKQNRTTPNEYRLFQNYPNPFNPSTKIKFSIAKNSVVSIILYDILGNKIAVLAQDHFAEGTYDFSFDSRRYNNLVSGIYIVRLVTDDFISSIKIMLMK